MGILPHSFLNAEIVEGNRLNPFALESRDNCWTRQKTTDNLPFIKLLIFFFIFLFSFLTFKSYFYQQTTCLCSPYLLQNLPTHRSKICISNTIKQPNAFSYPNQIVISYNLTKLLNKEEIIAVIEHEVNHIKKHHHLILIFLTSLQITLYLFLIFLIFKIIFSSFNVLKFFFICFLFLFINIFTIIEKKQMEFEADKVIHKKELISALLKIGFYSDEFYKIRPFITERIKRIAKD